MRFNINVEHAYLFIDSDETKCFGIESILNDILIKRSIKLNIVNYSLMNLVSPIIFFILFSILIQYKFVLSLFDFISYAVIIFGFALIISLIIGFLPKLLYNRIYIKYSWEKLSFFKRNMDNIIVTSLGAVIGGLILFFIIKLISTSPKP
jgi:hypothetical protein